MGMDLRFTSGVGITPFPNDMYRGLLLGWTNKETNGSANQVEALILLKLPADPRVISDHPVF
jgi:hypothetical protein